MFIQSPTKVCAFSSTFSLIIKMHKNLEEANAYIAGDEIRQQNENL